jgi:hypothetical protein
MHSIRVIIRGMCAVRLLKVRALLPYRLSMSFVEKRPRCLVSYESVALTLLPSGRGTGTPYDRYTSM